MNRIPYGSLIVLLLSCCVGVVRAASPVSDPQLTAVRDRMVRCLKAHDMIASPKLGLDQSYRPNAPNAYGRVYNELSFRLVHRLGFIARKDVEMSAIRLTIRQYASAEAAAKAYGIVARVLGNAPPGANTVKTTAIEPYALEKRTGGAWNTIAGLRCIRPTSRGAHTGLTALRSPAAATHGCIRGDSRHLR